MIKKFLARESLVSDIPTGNGKTANLFYSVERARETEMVREVYMEMVETEIAEGRWTEFGVRL
jgi:hypothetical protein